MPASPRENVLTNLRAGIPTRILHEETISRVHARGAGIFKKHVSVGDNVKKGQLLCEIVHPLEGSPLEQITAPADGTIFFAHNKQLVMERTDVFRLIPCL